MRSATVAVLGLFAFGCTSNEAGPPARAPAAPTEVVTVPAASITRIADPSLVCMVNDMYMGRPQIPVAVDGETYFGCCEACEARLTSDPAIRTAVDPISGAPVDKATAVLAQDVDGKVLYFASEDTFRRYRP